MIFPIKILSLLHSLRDGEHAHFGEDVTEGIKDDIESVPSLSPVWALYEAVVRHELLLFKVSKSSAETDEISKADRTRDGIFREVKRRVGFYAQSNHEDLRQAAVMLQFITHPYDTGDARNLYEETEFIRNFLVDMNKAVNAQAIALIPGFADLLTDLADTNDHLNQLYTQRLQTLEELSRLGKRANVRRDADRAVLNLFIAANSVYQTNELSAKDPNIKEPLERAAIHVDALISQLRRILSQRGHKRKHKPGNPAKPDAPQTPGGNNPPPPPANPQPPTTTLPPAPPVPPQNPDTGNPPINPDDLNPPAVGER